jgi:hypothetical protein
VNVQTRALQAYVKPAVGGLLFDGEVELLHAASSAAQLTRVMTREERIVLVPSPMVKVRCREESRTCW